MSNSRPSSYLTVGGGVICDRRAESQTTFASVAFSQEGTYAALTASVRPGGDARSGTQAASTAYCWLRPGKR
jgi:hypothetical protein